MKFVHLNSHSHYSLLKALGSPKELAKKAKELGFEAIGLTDNSFVYGLIEFYKAAKENNIKPILGASFYFTDKTRFIENQSLQNNLPQITLIAYNNDGYHNLLKLSTEASFDGKNSGLSIVDIELLKKFNNGLILLSGGDFGPINHQLKENNLEKAKEISQNFKEIFSDNFYLELQRNNPNIINQSIEQNIIEISKELSISLVATQNSLYFKKEDAPSHDILVSIGEQTNINNPDRLIFEGDYSLKSEAEMLDLFKDQPKACENTVTIAESCNIAIQFGQYLIPQFKTPKSQSSKDYLKELCLKGLEELIPSERKEKALKQLEYELGIVDKMGFNDYFLIVWDFINFAKSNGIVVGPGRGSAAGAMIAYTLKITELDPIEHGLVFERFLNPDRVSMPDIDIDFADNRRHEVLEYTINKYGNDCVSQVITFGTMSAKAAVRDIGRGMGYPYSEVDRIAKAIPNPILGKHTPLSISIEKDPNLSEFYKNDSRAKALLDNAIKIEGTVRNAGTHACAVIVADRPLVNFTALQRATDGSDGHITQYSMKYLEEIGLLKMDFLGLKNLTIIENALLNIEKLTNQKLDITKIPIDDQKTYQLLQEAETIGVFQLESSGMRRYIRELKPTNFEDIVAMISLYRPGPMEWIPAYIEGKHQPEKIKYIDESLKDILKETNGIAIYQEQILLIARHFAGFSLGEADILRRAVGKKDPKALYEQKDKFIQGAIKCGHTELLSKDIFEKVIEPFAGYGFNKAHAACYAMISYRTSYLKANHPTALMAALLTSDSDNLERIALEMNDCENMNIEVLPPSINESKFYFSPIEESKIRFGLGAIKGLGEGVINQIVEERNRGGKFNSLEDFISRIPIKLVNKRTIESLAYSGTLDEFGDRREIAENYENLSQYAKNIDSNKNENKEQSGLFELIPEDNLEHLNPKLKLKKFEPLSTMEKLSKEKVYLGIYVSSTPLKGLTEYLKHKATFIGDITDKNIGKNIKIAGILNNIKTIITKSGKAMAYGELEDITNKIDIVIFPKIYENFKFKLQEDQLLIIDGKLELRRDRLQISVIDIKSVSLETMINNAKQAGIYNLKEKINKRDPQIDFEKYKEKEEIKQEKSEIDKKTQNIEQEKKFKNLILSNEKIVLIKIPKSFSNEKLNQLKNLIEHNAGNELDINLEIQNTTIKTNLKINNNIEVLNKIDKFLD